MNNEIRKIIAQACLKHHDTCETSNDMEARRIMQALIDNGYVISKAPKPINLMPLGVIPHQWTELTGAEYTRIFDVIKTLEPIETSGSLHVHEEIYLVEGDKYRLLAAISDDPTSPDYQPSISVY